MFELPAGTPVNQTISLEEGVLQPFAHGAISTSGRRKTPVGHRLVRGGRVVVFGRAKKNTLLGGVEAKQRLEQLEAEQKSRLLASSYTIAELGSLAELV